MSQLPMVAKAKNSQKDLLPRKKYFPNLFLLLCFALNFESSFLFCFIGQAHKYLQRGLTKQKKRLENVFEYIQHVSCKSNYTINFYIEKKEIINHKI